MSNKEHVAFIGLGIMGLPMAINLLKAGYTVSGYNRSPQRTAELAAAGGTAAAGIPEAVAGADVIITMVPDSPDVAAVVRGEQGVFAHAPAGALWIDNSSIRPDVAAELAAEARAAGLRPVGSGQTVKAANQLIVAANIQALSEAVVFLEAYGVDTAAALRVLGGGLAGSKVLEQKGQKILDRSFGPGFRLALHNKDLGS